MRNRPEIGPGTLSGLRWSAAICSLAGLGALVAHIFSLLEMRFFLAFVGAPSVVLLFVLAAYAKRINAEAVVSALVLGLIGGVLGTFVYDGVRYALTASGVFDYDGFTAIYIFGGWITGTEPTTTEAAVAGWTYHFWNGISFGLFYALLFGGRHWMIGVLYGVLMELMMLGLFPFFLQVTDRVDFVALSLVGHLFYGLVLGVIVQSHTGNWELQHGAA